MKRFFLITLTLIALALNLTGCGDHVETFIEYVREGNYADAITLYQEKLMDDSESYGICQEAVETYLEETLTALVTAVENGTISEERINESVLRILSLKYKYGIITE